LVASHEPDLILVLGDLEPAWTDGLADVELPKLGVAGNHDAPDLLAVLGVENLHLSRIEVGGLSFSGFGGSPRYSREGRNEWTEEEAEAMLAGLPAADVLLTHSPARGRERRPRRPRPPRLASPTRVGRARATRLAAARPHAAEPRAPDRSAGRHQGGARARGTARGNHPAGCLTTPMGQA
jgi:hypothetical protein